MIFTNTFKLPNHSSLLELSLKNVYKKNKTFSNYWTIVVCWNFHLQNNKLPDHSSLLELALKNAYKYFQLPNHST